MKKFLVIKFACGSLKRFNESVIVDAESADKAREKGAALMKLTSNFFACAKPYIQK